MDVASNKRVRDTQSITLAASQSQKESKLGSDSVSNEEKKKTVSRKGAKAQSKSTPRAPVNQGFAFFLCVTSAFAGDSFLLMVIHQIFKLIHYPKLR
jgi:hypothetical protein